MSVASDSIEVRSLMGRNRTYSQSEVRRVAKLRYRVLPLIRRPCVKVTFTTDRAAPLFFRPWRFRRLERAFVEAGWTVDEGESV